MKAELTKTRILACPLPAEGKETWLQDSKVPGLCVRVRANGSRVFFFRRRAGGKGGKITLGSLDQLGTVEAARAATRVHNAAIAANANPFTARKAAKVGGDHGPTLKTLWTHYLETYAKIHKRASSIKEDERMWTAYLSESWGSRPVVELTFGEVNRLKVEVAGIGDDDDGDDDAGPAYYQANRLLALLSKVFAEGCKAGIAAANPVAGVERFPEQTRERHLNAEEIKALWVAMKAHADHEPDAVDFIKLALATGARRGMLRAMEWSEVNLTFKTWTVPAAKMKNGKLHTVPLVPQAMEILQRRRSEAPEGARWVFPSDSPTGHLMSIKKSLAAILKAAGISGVRLHDLRRTVATWMNSTGANDIIIASLLAHSYRSVTGVYARVTVDTVRQALAKAVDSMWTAAGEAVVPAMTGRTKSGRKSKMGAA